MLAAVLTIAPVAGIPPNNAEPTLPSPCAINSIFERCLELIILSATTHDSSDSIAARMAIVKASGNISLTTSKENAGTCNCGSRLLISYKSPMVLTFMSKTFTIAIPTRTAIREPGIVLFMYGHKIKIARQITPTSNACQLMVVIFFKIASAFSMVSMVAVPAG